jgi:hypothetical protein
MAGSDKDHGRSRRPDAEDRVCLSHAVSVAGAA